MLAKVCRRTCGVHFLQAGAGAYAVEDAHDADEVAIAPIGGENVGRSASLPLTHQFDDRGIAGRSHLRTGLRVGERHAVVVRLDPLLSHRPDLHPPEAGQELGADRREPGRMLSFALHLLHDFAEVPDFAGAQTPLQLVRGDDPHAVRRTLLDDPEPARVIEEAAKRADRPPGHARATRGLSAATGATLPRRPAGRDVGLEPLNIGELQMGDDTRADHGLMCCSRRLRSPARRGLNRPPVPAEQAAASASSRYQSQTSATVIPSRAARRSCEGSAPSNDPFHARRADRGFGRSLQRDPRFAGQLPGRLDGTALRERQLSATNAGPQSSPRPSAAAHRRALRANPLGIFVNAISWSRELSQ